MLAWQPSDKAVSTLSLLDVQVDQRGEVRYKEVLKIPASEQKAAGNVPPATVKAAFSGPTEVSQQQLAWHVTLEVPGDGVEVRFGFDMDITIL